MGIREEDFEKHKKNHVAALKQHDPRVDEDDLFDMQLMGSVLKCQNPGCDELRVVTLQFGLVRMAIMQRKLSRWLCATFMHLFCKC